MEPAVIVIIGFMGAFNSGVYSRYICGTSPQQKRTIDVISWHGKSF
jgi:hypothetical protein